MHNNTKGRNHREEEEEEEEDEDEEEEEEKEGEENRNKEKGNIFSELEKNTQTFFSRVWLTVERPVHVVKCRS